MLVGCPALHHSFMSFLYSPCLVFSLSQNVEVHTKIAGAQQLELCARGVLFWSISSLKPLARELKLANGPTV